MPVSLASALLACGMAMACACVLAKRSSNWRIRLLAITIALMTLCQAVMFLGQYNFWVGSAVGDAAASVELVVSALCLTAVHLLNRENCDRKDTHVRLRVAESVPTLTRRG